MMVAYAIREARRSDAGAIARKVCAGRWLAYQEAGMDIRRRLVDLVGASPFARACLIEGRIVAMWGLAGTLLSPTGQVWLAVSPEAATYPRALLKEVRAQLIEMVRLKPEITTTVHTLDDTAIRFAEFLGFASQGEPIQVDSSRVFVIPMVLRRG